MTLVYLCHGCPYSCPRAGHLWLAATASGCVFKVLSEQPMTLNVSYRKADGLLQCIFEVLRSCHGA